jgi:hypothetical protein
MTTERVLSESEKKKEDWMNSKWRPMMGWMYMLVCTTDFVLFPILWSLIQAMAGGQVHSQWQPITLQGAGLFHIAMGAVLGIAAFGRTQEKLGGANNGGLQPVGQSVTTTFGAPSTGGFGNSGGFNSPAPSSFGGGFGSPAPNTSFAPAPSWGATQTSRPMMSSTGKPMPMQLDQPEL